MNWQKIALKKLLIDNDYSLYTHLNKELFSKSYRTIFVMIDKYYDAYSKLPTIDVLIAYIKSNFADDVADVLVAILESLNKIKDNSTNDEVIKELNKEKVVRELDNVAEDFLSALKNKQIDKVVKIAENIQVKAMEVNNKMPDDIRETDYKMEGLATLPIFLPTLQEQGIHLAGLSVIGSGSGCVDEDTEFLTPNGWKKIKDYCEGDLVLEVNPFNNYESFFSKPLDYIKEKDDRLAYRVLPNNRTKVSMFVTAEHKIVYERVNKKGKRNINVTTADKFFELNNNNTYIPSTFLPKNLQGVDYTDDEIKLIVAFCADGSKSSKNRIRFHLKKQRKQKYLEQILNKLGIDYRVNHKENGYKEYYVKDIINGKKEKGLHNYFWGASLKQLQLIVEEVIKWDGGKDKRTGNYQFYTTNKEEADFVQYAFSVVFNKVVSIVTHNRVGREYKTNGKTYIRKAIEYSVNVTSSKSKVIPNQNIKLEKLPNETKYCFTTNTGFWLARKDNYIFVTGNSGKSLFSLQQALYSYKETGVKVGVLSLELPLSQLKARMYSIVNDIPYYEAIKPENKEKILQWQREYFEPNSFFIKAIRYNVEEIRKAIDYMLKKGVKLIIIDYLNLVEADNYKEEWKQLADLAKDLHAKSVEHNIVILTPTQVNLSESKKGEVEATTRGSRELEFSSSLFLLIHQNKEEYKEKVARIIIKKARNAKRLTLMVRTEFEKMKFVDTSIIVE